MAFAKTASVVPKAKGLRRVGELLTGSRARALKAHLKAPAAAAKRQRDLRYFTRGTLGQPKKKGLGQQLLDIEGKTRAKIDLFNETLDIGTARHVGMTAAGGLAAAGLAAKRPKERQEESRRKLHRNALKKEAFGAALMQGIKGLGNFAVNSGKSISTAARTGGAQAAGQATVNAGRAGMQQAGNFIAQNPMAGATMVAAPAMAAGYAAGR